MIIQSTIPFENNRKVYNFLANSEDRLPYKRNKTLPEDAVNGSTVFVADQNVTYVYKEVKLENPTKRTVEAWFKQNTNVAVAIFYYASSAIEIEEPADDTALKTALAAAVEVTRVNTNGATSSLTYGSTTGTNYSLSTDGSVALGDHVARAIFYANTYGVNRYEVDEYGCPSITLDKVAAYGAGQASPLTNDNNTKVYCEIPYKIVASGAKSAPEEKTEPKDENK